MKTVSIHINSLPNPAYRAWLRRLVGVLAEIMDGLDNDDEWEEMGFGRPTEELLGEKFPREPWRG